MESDGGVSTRQVKLKVLYTFDAEHKNNHLARWPHTLDVQCAQIDEANIIGCVDLRTCLEAVTAASPELASNENSDYTVYAYDYSEPDVPLVGQGMLSKTLGQGQDGTSPADSEAMVTGRITKNVMGLFSKNAQETLEVKLRFTPVASTGFRRRSGSVSSNPETVQQHWNILSQTNGSFRPSSPMDTSGIEAMQRMLSEGGPPRDRMGSFQNDSFYNHGTSSRPVSRSGTPTQSQQFHPSSRQPHTQSRPASRGEHRTATHARRDSFNSGYYSGEEVVEEGPARKRAKIQKVDFPTRSNLNIERQPDSLRVAASIASSVRLHRPMPINATVSALQNSSNFTEEVVRPPTPIPQTKTKARGRPKKVVSANLRRGTKARGSSPSSISQQPQPETSFSSPEETRAGSITSTPADIPSSPPIMPDMQTCTTSPQLPPLVNEADSGFMSAHLEDLFDEEGALIDFNDFLHEKPSDAHQIDPGLQNFNFKDSGFNGDEDLMANLPSVFDDVNETGRVITNEMEPPPRKPNSAPLAGQASSSITNNHSTLSASRLAPALAPKIVSGFEGKRAQSVLPQIPASDPVGRSFQRSQTWAPDTSDAIMSDAITNDEQAKAKPRKRVGKEQTKARLENAIASGEMPPFCDNCGAIETPAWRRAYTKIFDCAWDDLETSLEPGECCYKEPIEHDADGNIIKFKGYKSERRSDEHSSEAWTQICLCNPCGLWFHKSKFPRPPEKWQKKDANEKKKKKRGPKPRKRATTSKSAPKSDAPTPASEDSSPADTAAEGGDADDINDNMTVTNDESNDDNEPDLPPMPREIRAGSAEPMNRGLRFHSVQQHTKYARREVQSSPALPGRTRIDAIEIDMTPKPLKRQLFPSPNSLKNKSDAVVTTNIKELLPSFVRRSPRLNKVRDALAVPAESVALVSVGLSNKENIAPLNDHDDDLSGLFDSGFDEIMIPSTPNRRSERLLFKTPSKTPAREFAGPVSPNAKRTPSAVRTPKNLHPAASIFISTVQRSLDPADMTPFSRSIHETLSIGTVQPLELPDTPRAKGSEKSKQTPKNASSKDINDVFDFPDLPSIKGSSPISRNALIDFNFSEMTTDRLQPDLHGGFDTDMPMPSSPPEGYFSSSKDHHADFWAEICMQNGSQSEYPDFEDDTGHGGGKPSEPRRSPRKHTT